MLQTIFFSNLNICEVNTCLSFRSAYYADSVYYVFVKQFQLLIFYYLISGNTELHADVVYNVNSRDSLI